MVLCMYQKQSNSTNKDFFYIIMVAMSNPHLGWAKSFAYHRICMCHLANNFITLFKDKLLKNLVCRAPLVTQRKFNRHLAIIRGINS